MWSKLSCVISDRDSKNIEEARGQRDVEPVIREFNNILDNLLETNGIGVQVALTNALERFKSEMRSSEDYHKEMAESLAAEKTSPTIILQHRILADIYQSLCDHA
jgi:hypothetical protein